MRGPATPVRMYWRELFGSPTLDYMLKFYVSGTPKVDWQYITASRAMFNIQNLEPTFEIDDKGVCSTSNFKEPLHYCLKELFNASNGGTEKVRLDYSDHVLVMWSIISMIRKQKKAFEFKENQFMKSMNAGKYNI